MPSQKILTVITILILCTTILSGQNKRMLLRSNGHRTPLNPEVRVKDALENIYVESSNGERVGHSFPGINRTSEVIDTISYFKHYPSTLSSFMFDGQDVQMMWFEAPAHLTIKAAGFSCSDTEDNINNASVSLQLIKLNWTKDQLMNVEAPVYMGYYPSVNDAMNNSAPFPDEATGDWLDKSSGSYPLPPWDENDYDLWSDNGNGVEIFPEVQRDEDGNPELFSYQWVEMNEQGYEPELERGEVFAVVVKNNGTDWTTTNDMIGFWSNNNAGYPGWKYYEKGRFSEDEPGWWVREYTWDFAVVVEYTWITPLHISNVTELTTTFMESPRDVYATVRDSNPAGGTDGISAVWLCYSVDSSDYAKVEMQHMWDNKFSASIPAQLRGSEIQYYIEARDVNDNVSTSQIYDYTIFKVSEYNFHLLIFNGFDEPDGFPESYYFTIYPDWDGNYHNYFIGDFWAYGKVPQELINNYRNVFEITTNGPVHDNTAVVRQWLEEGLRKDYLLAGDEWLSFRTGGQNSAFQPGSFEYDILGITEAYNDIPGTDTVSNVYPVKDSYFGGMMYDTMIVNGHTSIDYNPSYEIELPNLLDGYNVLPSVEVEITADGKDGNNYVIGSHKNTDKYDRIMFLSFDPLSLDKNPPYTDPSYFWYSMNESAVFHVAAKDMLLDGSIAGPPAPYLSEVTVLADTRSTDSRTVRAKITTDYGWHPPDSTELFYSVNGGEFLSKKMDYAGNDYYSASLPGYTANTRVTYKVRAKVNVDEYDDPEDFISISDTISYMITPFSNANTLIIFNGFEGTTGYPQDNYFMGLDEDTYESFDKLAGETLTAEIAENYENIFEIHAKSTAFDNKDVIRKWLSGSGSRNYFLSSQYFLKGGSKSGDTLFNQGDFEYDVLGLLAGRTDINIFDEQADTLTTLTPIADSELGSSMYTHAANSQNDILYRFELNEIDAFVAKPGNELFMKALGKDNAEYFTGTNRKLEDGNKVVFQSYDPVLVYSSPDDYWYGGSEYSPIVQAYHWFNQIPTDVADENIVYNFSLSQNYPNPFNPSTTIEYSIPVSSNEYVVGSNQNRASSIHHQVSVTLKVYDILGREITTLVDEHQRPGVYHVNFNSAKHGLASGVYFYSLRASSFSQTKKMLLLK